MTGRHKYNFKGFGCYLVDSGVLWKPRDEDSLNSESGNEMQEWV